MTETSDFEAIPQEKLQTLSTFAKEARELSINIEELENNLSAMKQRLQVVTEKEMPDIMMELGMEQIKLTTGEKLTMKKFYSASIKPELQEAAFKWLRDNGHDSLIKNKVEGSFGKGEDEKVREIMEKLQSMVPGVFTAKTSVHSMTLKSFVKEQIEAGSNLPQEMFGVFIGNKITIK
jgi:hypothetical protein